MTTITDIRNEETSQRKPLLTAVSTRDLRFSYWRGCEALRGVDLHVPACQHLAVVGASGSGKTTLLRCLAGGLAPACGQVSCAGRIATIHQDLRLVEERSALQNVLHGSMGRHSLFRTLFWFPADEKRRALRLLQRVGLSHRVFSPVKKLSGGEKQRVAIARALMQEPTVLLADEPVSALDDVNKHSIMRLLRELSVEKRLTLVTVLHDSALAETYADRIVRLEDGKLVDDGETLKPWTPKKKVVEEVERSGEERVLTPLEPVREKISAWKFICGALAAVFVYAWAVKGIGISERDLEGIWGGMFGFLLQLLPTSFAELSQIPWVQLGASLVETVQMALIGTTLGIFLSWPLAALAAKNSGPAFIRTPMRFFLNAVRTVPSLIWALMFVAAVGLGSVAGILALVAYSVGYLSKFFYEAFEAVQPGPPEALREIGASGLQRFLHAVWPASRPAILSSSLFMFEYNVRAASVLGVVDAGGIGFYIKQYIDFRFFPAVLVSLLMLLIVVLVLDAISCRVRERLMRPV